MSKTVAIIPARGGSKGIPRKNIRDFCGKPLIAHSILAGLQAQQVHEVYVSTEDQEIAEVAKACGAQIIARPMELASDTASTFSVLHHASSVLNFPEVLVTLQPTSPLRTAEQIDHAINLLDGQTETVVSVCPTHRYHWREENGYGLPNFESRRRRQEMGTQFIENGSIYVTRKSVFQRVDDRLGMGITSTGKIKLYIMDEQYSVELDSETDFTILEQLYKSKEEKEN